MNVRWKVDSGETNLRQGSLKRQVFAIIRTIITKRSNVAFVETIFCGSCRVRFFHFIQFNCDLALRSRFHAYVVSVYTMSKLYGRSPESFDSYCY